MFNLSLPLQLQFRIIFTLKCRDCHLNAPQMIITSWFASSPSSMTSCIWILLPLFFFWVDCLWFIDRNGDCKLSILKFKAWNYSLIALTNNLRSNPYSPLMIKIAARIVLEEIINEQINILTQALFHVCTLNNFFSLVFHSFLLIFSPLLPLTTQLLLMSS